MREKFYWQQDITSSKPKIIVETDSIHSSGIYSAHALGGKLLTRSKDSPVTLSQIKEAKIEHVRTFDQLESIPFTNIFQFAFPHDSLNGYTLDCAGKKFINSHETVQDHAMGWD